MPIDHRIISIGTLSAHPLWNEGADVRTGHATCVLVSVDDTRIVVNPGLPAAAMAARMGERTDVKPDEITHVFLTSFQPDHRRGLPVFAEAEILLAENEREAAESTLQERIEESRNDGETLALFERDLELLQRTRVAPDQLVEGVDLFPLPGVTPGTCGLLLPLPGHTVLIAGDAVATVEHLQQGKVLPSSVDLESALESFREAVEIADVIVPGRDNIVLNPLRRAML
jgi:glyoxylase-like metal-dependent hydrolase (beta-lactamase superfamily II)